MLKSATHPLREERRSPASPDAPRTTRKARFAGAVAVLTVLALGVGDGLLGQPAVAEASAGIEVSDTRANGTKNAFGVDLAGPRFDWKIDTAQRAVLQTGYRLQVASSKAALESGQPDVWDSGLVKSEQLSGLAYAGPGLEPDSRYYWRVYSETDTAGAGWSAATWFQTGIDDSYDADWVGTEGQGGSEWTDYTVEYDFRIEKEAAALVFRAASAGTGYMWQFNAVDNPGMLTFKPHIRVNGQYTSLGSIAVSETLVPSSEVASWHRVRIHVSGSTITTTLDGQQIDQRDDARIARGGIGIRQSSSEAALFRDIRVEDAAGEVLFELAESTNPFTGGEITPAGLRVSNASPILASGEIFDDFEVELTTRILGEASTLYFRSSPDGGNSYMWQINLSSGAMVFKPHVRVGGGYQTIAEIPVNESVIAADASHDSFTMRVRAEGSEITTFINDVEIDVRTLTEHTSGTFGFRASGTETAEFSDLVVRSLGGAELFSAALRGDGDQVNPFTGGALTAAGLRVEAADIAQRLTPESPQVRGEFRLEKPAEEVARATWYTSARGIYQGRVNGEPINNDRFAPGWTDYRERIQYQSTDITDQLIDGDNALAAQLAPGWYAGEIGWFGPGQYGDSVSFLGVLEVHFLDGTTQRVSTDDSWTMSSGPVVSADLLQGEHYDQRRETEGWDQPGFDDSDWDPVIAEEPSDVAFVPAVGPPVEVVQEVKPVSHREVSPGVWVFDLGQQISGVTRLNVDGPEGTRVTLRHAQQVHPDGSIYASNLWAGSPAAYASQTDSFTLAGGPAQYEPQFTYHGFRYVEVTGYPGQPDLDDVTGLVFANAMDRAGEFATGDAMLDQLQSNIGWSLLGNMVSVPTDTNARAERLGWAGDATFSAQSATFNWDVYEFYRKWMDDLVDSQSEEGLVSNVAPLWPATSGGYGGGWGDAIIAIPYAAWQRYGDPTIVEENYEAMKKWVLYLEQTSQGTYLLGDNMGQAGDWMSVNAGTSGRFTATAYWGWDLIALAEMAQGLGKAEDAEDFLRMHSKVRDAYAAAYVSEDGTVQPGTQAAYVLALYADLVPDAQRDAAAGKLVEAIAERDNHLSTGFAATGWLLPVLEDIGREDLAYEILQKEDYPSWGYMVAQGATTIWERWDFILPDSGAFHPNPLASSDNHAVFGSVGDWMYSKIGGVTADEPGYRRFTVAPQPYGSLQQSSFSFASRYGEVAASWVNSEESGIALDVRVPTGTTATIEVPIAEGLVVVEGGRVLADVEGVELVELRDGVAVLRAGSGDYSFATAVPPAPGEEGPNPGPDGSEGAGGSEGSGSDGSLAITGGGAWTLLALGALLLLLVGGALTKRVRRRA